MPDAFHDRLLCAALLSCTLGGVACASEEDDPFVPQYETDRLKIGLAEDADLCKGHRDLWEEHLDYLEEIFPVFRDFAWVFVYRGDNTEQLAADCGWNSDDAGGCWDGSVVRGTPESVPHELVHAWLSTIQRNPLPALREGVAVWMSGIAQHAEAEDLSVDELVLVDPAAYGDYPKSLYREVGHFVAWWIDTYGAETFTTIYTRTSKGMTADAITPIFIDVLGRTPEMLLLEYHTSARDYYPAIGAAACGRGPVIPWEDDAATWPTEGSCAEGPFFGYAATRQRQRVTIEVTAPGTYLLETAGRYAAMRHCLVAPVDEADLPELHPDGVGGDWLFSEPMTVFGSESDDWDDRPLELVADVYEVWVERTGEMGPTSPGIRLLKL
ncbi:MAG: hypothetical protein JNL82_41010 [Myxococcales bacterium]|nr:hypothetical protein [Myxococcales bacterium]